MPNAFFGMSLWLGVLQVIFAFMAGSGFYLLRRVSGAVLVPMAMHGLWDFSTFSHQASGMELTPLSLVFQFGTYLISIVLIVVLLGYERRGRERSAVAK